jgi:acyl carrier protein
MNTQTSRSSREIQDWIVAWVARETKADPSSFEVSEPFVNLGLSSRQAVLLSGELEDWLERKLPANLVWDHPTIEKLADHLARTA